MKVFSKMSSIFILLLVLFVYSIVGQLCVKKPVPDEDELKEVAVKHLNEFLPSGTPYVTSTINNLEEIPPPYVHYKVSVNLQAACRGTVCQYPNEICSMSIFIRDNGEAEVQPKTVECRNARAPATRQTYQEVFSRFPFKQKSSTLNFEG